MTDSAALWAIVPAAGVGRRMGGSQPKQYLHILGKTVLEITLTKLLSVPGIRSVVVVLAENDPYFSGLSLSGNISTVTGGAERADSVYQGLCHILERGGKDDWVLVHDAARPCVRAENIRCLIDTATAEKCGAILAVPVSDTLKKANGGDITHTVSREYLWAAHTPQMFRVGELHDALRKAQANSLPVTDEASAIELAGGRVMLVPDSRDNIKITQPEDLRLAEVILRQQFSDD